jgi:hypothetical protein
MYNKGKIKVQSTAVKNTSPWSKDVLMDPAGQWKYPGQITKIPSGDITMRDVPYPVLGIDNLGNQQMMMPEGEYQFPGNMVTEIPMAQKGGTSKLAPAKKKSLEDNLNYYLGYPMTKATIIGERSAGKDNDAVDNIRHPLAGMFTTQGLMNKGLDPITAFIGANALGIGHEITSPNTEDGMSLWNTIREGAEDVFNNMVGAGIGIMPGLTDAERIQMIQRLSYANKLPDGYDIPQIQGQPKHNMYFKKFGGEYEELELTNEEIEEYRRGGFIVEELPQAQLGLSTDVDMGIAPDFSNPNFYTHYNIPAPKSNRQSIIKKNNQSKELKKSIVDYREWEEGKQKALQRADVVTDVMQMGKFVPHPLAQSVGNLGTYLGSAIDLYQGSQNLYDGNYVDAAVNLGSTAAAGFLKHANRMHTRDMYNTEPNSLADIIARTGTRDGRYIPLTQLPKPFRSKVTRDAVNINRLVGIGLAGETLYDANQKVYGGELELTDEEVEQYRKGGFIVEELPKAQTGYNTPEYNEAYQQGQVTRYNPQTDIYQGQDLPVFEMSAKDTRVADAVRKERDEFARDYMVPAIKTAASFSPVGPLIGLTDAAVAFGQGDTFGGVLGAGLEALPYGIGRGAKALSKFKNIGRTANTEPNIIRHVLEDPNKKSTLKKIGEKLSDAKIFPSLNITHLPKDISFENNMYSVVARGPKGERVAYLDLRPESHIAGYKKPDGTFHAKNDVIDRMMNDPQYHQQWMDRLTTIEEKGDWLKPAMIKVDKNLWGNQMQDVLYQKGIELAKSQGFKGVRSGDTLLSPGKTKKAHERFMGEALGENMTAGVRHQIKGLTGHTNPNVEKEFLDRYAKLNKLQINPGLKKFSDLSNPSQFLYGVAAMSPLAGYAAVKSIDGINYLANKMQDDKRMTSLPNKQFGGAYDELELTDEQVKELIRQGYKIERV